MPARWKLCSGSRLKNSLRSAWYTLLSQNHPYNSTRSRFFRGSDYQWRFNRNKNIRRGANSLPGNFIHYFTGTRFVAAIRTVDYFGWIDGSATGSANLRFTDLFRYRGVRQPLSPPISNKSTVFSRVTLQMLY